MHEVHLRMLRCPRCKKRLQVTQKREKSGPIEEGIVTCMKGHSWTIKDGIVSLVHPPVTEKDTKWIAEYDEMAEKYDEMVLQYDDWLSVDMMKERQQLAQFLPIEGPAKILDVSIGTAANFVALHDLFQDRMGRFNLHGLDLSMGMLKVAKRKLEDRGLTINVVHGSVFNIPYKKNSFNIVNHSGGLNTFSDISKALEEMMRVVRPQGLVVVSDEGLSPAARKTERGKAIIEANSLFAAKPPLEYIPPKAKDVEVSYVLNDTFYQIIFRK